MFSNIDFFLNVSEKYNLKIVKNTHGGGAGCKLKPKSPKIERNTQLKMTTSKKFKIPLKTFSFVLVFIHFH